MRPVIGFSDLHLHTKTPRMRLDEDFLDTGLRKLQWIAKRAKELDAVAVFHGGDITEKCDGWEPADIRRIVVDGFSHFEDIPLYTVLGNHDIPGALDEYKWYVAGTLTSPTVRALTLLPFTNRGVVPLGSNFFIEGFHWKQAKTDKLLAGEYKPHTKQHEGKVRIAVVHAPVGPPGLLIPDYIPVNTLDIPYFNYVHVGDIHNGFEPYQCESGSIIVNTGAVLRKTITETQRKPKIAIYWPDGTMKEEEIPILPASQVFKEETLAKTKQVRELGLSAAIASAKIKQTGTPREWARQIGKEANFSEPSIEMLTENIKE